MGRPLQPEERLHIAVAGYLRLALDPMSQVIWTSIDQSMGKGRVTRAIAGARGVRMGWPDIQIMWTQGEVAESPLGETTQEITLWRMVFIELKTKVGRLSPSQITCGRYLEERTLRPVQVCRSVEDVEDVLRRFAIPMRQGVKL